MLVKKIYSLLLLLLFLFPVVEKEVHSYEHKDDFHCTTKSDKHFHSKEHYCSICDFNIPFVDAPIAYQSDFIILFKTVTHLIYTPGLISAGPDYCLSPRAPPAQS